MKVIVSLMVLMTFAQALAQSPSPRVKENAVKLYVINDENGGTKVAPPAKKKKK